MPFSLAGGALSFGHVGGELRPAVKSGVGGCFLRSRIRVIILVILVRAVMLVLPVTVMPVVAVIIAVAVMTVVIVMIAVIVMSDVIGIVRIVGILRVHVERGVFPFGIAVMPGVDRVAEICAEISVEIEVVVEKFVGVFVVYHRCNSFCFD